MAGKIKNPNYRKFLDEGIIDPINDTQLKQALDNVSGSHTNEGRAFLITLYATGARPVEVLNLKSMHFYKDKAHLVIDMPGLQGSGKKMTLPRKIPLSMRIWFVKELWEYVSRLPPEMLAFYHYRGMHINKRGNKEITRSARYYVQKWFDGVVKDSIPPYFLRHNRFSKMAMAGASDRDIQFIKGAKSISSVQPYAHLSMARAKKISKFIRD